MMTRIALIVLLVAGICALATADSIRLKRGSTYSGTVTNITEDGLQIITSMGRLTFRWNVLDNETIEKYNPELYEQIRAEELRKMEELIKKRGYVKYKGTWYPPEKAKALEMQDKGFELYEGEWLPTNEVADIKFRAKMEARGMIEYKGQWYTPEELEVVKEAEANRGLKIGAKTDEVLQLWGEPSERRKSAEFASRQREMWIYRHEDKDLEDRVVFELGAVKQVMIDKPLSD